MSPEEVREGIEDARRHLDAAMRCMSVPKPEWEQAARELNTVEEACWLLGIPCYEEAAKIYRLSDESKPR